MNLHQLRFVREAVRQNFNLTEAARALYTSQPGVSKAIIELEEELGVDIFTRHGKRIRGLTEPGRAVLRSVELIMQEVDGLKRIGKEFAAHDSGSFTIATTHFPWTDAARTSDFQRQACDGLLRLTSGRSLVVCGDFNAPRGREIFTRLAGTWRDNVPPIYDSSIDPVLHRVPDLRLMVDGVFSTPDYDVSAVTLHQGVSDHRAITALVSRYAP